MENIQSLEQQQFTCEQCFRSFRKKNKLNRHIKEIHLNIKAYTCNICHKSFKRNSHLKRHQIVHSEDPKPFKCLYPNCLMRFSDKYHLQRHVRVKHKNINFSCENCNLSFEKKLFLYKHNFQSHKIEKPFKCAQNHCFKSFYTKGVLAKHLRHHEHPFIKKTKNSLHKINTKCESNNTKETGEELFEHDHEDVGKKIDLSNIINEGEIEIKKNFDDFAMEHHVLIGNNVVLSDEHSQKLQGLERIQMKRKNDKKRVKEEIIQKDGEKFVFACVEENCGKSYSTLHNLKTHIRTAHLKSRDFICCFENCRKSFLHNKSLKAHLMKAHGIDH